MGPPLKPAEVPLSGIPSFKPVSLGSLGTNLLIQSDTIRKVTKMMIDMG